MVLRSNLAHHLFFVVKYGWNTATWICLHVVYGCFQATMQRWVITHYQRPHGPQSLRDLLSGPLQKEFANPSSRTMVLSPGCTLESLGDLLKNPGAYIYIYKSGRAQAPAFLKSSPGYSDTQCKWLSTLVDMRRGKKCTVSSLLSSSPHSGLRLFTHM